MRILLGVTGSVAAYRACDLARELMRAGHEVRVCLTKSAAKFVTPALFEALTGHPCLIDAFDEPVPGQMAHIDWAKETDLVLVAPLTANTLNKLAYGFGDNMLTTIALAFQGPLLLAPAMNPAMYSQADVQASLKKLQARGAGIVEPATGLVACGDEGQGKLAPVEDIVAAVEQMRRRSELLKGQTILITSGPTQEPIDSVRFITNRSSGRMGAALAQAALLLGARVVVVSGPVGVAYPLGAEVFMVRTAEEMLDQAKTLVSVADWVIGAAAVADYRPATPSTTKLRRSCAAVNLELVANPDIIAELAKSAKPGTKVVGFAAEPGLDLEYAKEKLDRKKLDAIVHNDISNPAIGFESDVNSVTLISATSNPQSSGERSKLEIAFWIFEQLSGGAA